MIERSIGRTRIVFTDRHDGASAGPYASRNLADHVGDAPAAVAQNRARLGEELDIAPASWRWLRQVHGAHVVEADRETAPPVAPEADAAIATTAGVALTVLVADCGPVALACGDAVGVVHAGWRGLESGVVGAAVDALHRVSAGPVRAVLGPCIHADHYEFGEEELARLGARFGDEVCATTKTGRPAFDLPAAVRVALGRAGVDELDDVDVCTACSPDHFSHRRDGVTGRQALVAVRGR
jgi:YfiH family protein